MARERAKTMPNALVPHKWNEEPIRKPQYKQRSKDEKWKKTGDSRLPKPPPSERRLLSPFLGLWGA